MTRVRTAGSVAEALVHHWMERVSEAGRLHIGPRDREALAKSIAEEASNLYFASLSREELEEHRKAFPAPLRGVAD